MFRAKDTFWAPGNRRIVKGDLVAPHDPVVKGREELFEAVVIPQALQPGAAAVEQQENDPGSGAPAPAGETGGPLIVVGEDGPETVSPPDGSTTPGSTPGDNSGDDGQAAAEPTPAAKKTTARKPTTAGRRGTGGDAK